MVALILPLRQQRRSIKRRNHKLLHDSLDQKLICAQASASDGCKKMLVGRLGAARGASRRDLCAPRYHSVVFASPQSHRFLRSRIRASFSDASRERPTRPHPQTFAACSFAPQHPLPTYLTQTQAVGVWHALHLLLAFWPSAARFTRYKTNGSSAACSFYCTCVAVAMSGWANDAHARAAPASVWAQGMLLAGQWALCTS